MIYSSSVVNGHTATDRNIVILPRGKSFVGTIVFSDIKVSISKLFRMFPTTSRKFPFEGWRIERRVGWPTRFQRTLAVSSGGCLKRSSATDEFSAASDALQQAIIARGAEVGSQKGSDCSISR